MKYASLILLSFIGLCMTAFYGCQHQQDLASIISKAEYLMYEYPDSSLKLIESIPHPERLTGKEQANYALILTQVRSQHSIPITSDSLIRIAVDYYQNSDDKENDKESLTNLGKLFGFTTEEIDEILGE